VSKRTVVIAAITAALAVSACGSQAGQTQLAACKANPTCARYFGQFTTMVKKYGPAPGMGATWCAAQIQGMLIDTNSESAVGQQLNDNQDTLKRACSLAVSRVQQ
jgi:hypothetical protein